MERVINCKQLCMLYLFALEQERKGKTLERLQRLIKR